MAREKLQRHTWNTAPVMARYRELVASGMTGLTASQVVLTEVQAEGRAPVFPGDTPSRNVPTRDAVPTGVSLHDILCEGCGNRPREGRYRKCAACRKAAHRERERV